MSRSAGLVALVILAQGCGGCDEAPERPSLATSVETCGAPAYGDANLARIYAITVGDGDPAVLSSDVDAVLARGEELARAALGAPEASTGEVDPAVAVVVQGDLWGLAARIRATGVSTPDRRSLLVALDTAMTRLALPPDQRLESVEAPAAARAALSEAAGWRELDTEHSVLTHERLFGMRRVFRIFVRGDHEARALSSQLVAIDSDGGAYLSDVPGEIELLELDDDGPTLARVLHLDREALGCREVRFREETEIRRIPDLGADDFLLRLGGGEALATMPCARCHEDRDAFSLPTDRTEVADRLGRLISQAEEDRRSIGLVASPSPSAE